MSGKNTDRKRSGKGQRTGGEFLSNEHDEARSPLPQSDRNDRQNLAREFSKTIKQSLQVTQSREVFLSDEDERDYLAAEMIVVRFANSVERVPDEIKSRIHAPWREIADMRNRLAHDYRDTDKEIVWNAVSSDLPKLARLILEDEYFDGI